MPERQAVRSDEDHLVGTELGEYRIERVIGRGGMGVVYLALDDLDRHVALKLMLPELANNADFRERFIRESQAVIDHPNVVTVYEAGEIENTLYLAMEFIDGLDLKGLIEREGRLLPARTVSIFRQAADALDAAHGKGLVHRDVKPQNILLAPGVDGDEDHVYLSDFGLVKRTSSQSSYTQSAYLMGTVQYMSPEQIEGKHVDGRADVYGLGCVLFEAVTGRIPFDKDSDVSVMWAHINDPPPLPSNVVPVLPKTVDDVIAKALAKSPDDRYLTCGELVADLGQAFGVSGGKRSKPVWSSGAVAASLQHSRPSSGSKSGRTQKGSAEPVAGPIGGWVAAAVVLLLAVGAVALAGNSEAPSRLLLDAIGQTPPADVADEPSDRRDRGDGNRSQGDRNERDRSQPRDNRPARGGEDTGRGAVRGTAPTGVSGSEPGGDPEPGPAAQASVITAPFSGTYEYAQEGYEQECLGPSSCRGGQNLPDVSRAQASRLPSSSDRITVRTATSTSSRWRTEVVTDYYDDRAEITAIEMRLSNSPTTPAWQERIEPASPIQWLRFPLSVGKKWEGGWDEDQHTANGSTTGNYDIEVVDRVTVSVGGRSVQAYRLHAVITFAGARTGRWDLNLWVDPRTRATLRTSGTIKVDSYEMSVVTTLRSGPGYS